MLLLLACLFKSDLERGQEALDAHDLAAAEQAFRKAALGDPRAAEALEGLGWTYLLAGQRTAAASAFDRCLSFSPEDGDCLRGRASVAMAEDRMPVAWQLLLRAQEAEPESPGVLSSVALYEFLTGESEAAEARYQLLAARYPDQAEYRLGLARVLARQDRHEEALALIEEALDLPATPVRYTSMLWLLQAQVLIDASAGREDARRCAETAPPVLAWLDRAALAPVAST